MSSSKKQIMGSGGYCVCPKCEIKIAHQSGVPCQEIRCTECNSKMMREGSHHHQLFINKKNKIDNT